MFMGVHVCVHAMCVSEFVGSCLATKVFIGSWLQDRVWGIEKRVSSKISVLIGVHQLQLRLDYCVCECVSLCACVCAGASGGGGGGAGGGGGGGGGEPPYPSPPPPPVTQ